MNAGARALFFQATRLEKRAELLWIVSRRFEFCHQRRDIAKFRSHRLDARALQNILRCRRTPCQLLRLPKRIGLKSYLRLSALVVRSSSITLPDASTHFRLA